MRQVINFGRVGRRHWKNNYYFFFLQFSPYRQLLSIHCESCTTTCKSCLLFLKDFRKLSIQREDRILCVLRARVKGIFSKRRYFWIFMKTNSFILMYLQNMLGSSASRQHNGWLRAVYFVTVKTRKTCKMPKLETDEFKLWKQIFVLRLSCYREAFRQST